MTQPEKYYAVDAEDVHLRISELEEDLKSIEGKLDVKILRLTITSELLFLKSIITNYPYRVDTDWHK